MMAQQQSDGATTSIDERAPTGWHQCGELDINGADLRRTSSSSNDSFLRHASNAKRLSENARIRPTATSKPLRHVLKYTLSSLATALQCVARVIQASPVVQGCRLSVAALFAMPCSSNDNTLKCKWRMAASA